MVLPVTLVTAAACALINLWLAIRITRRRVGGKILMGDGGDALMLSQGRAHANFTEYAPFVLILLALIEAARGSSPWLWALGGLFVLARVAHPIGMDRPAPNPWRAGGAMATWLVLAALAVWALVLALHPQRGPALVDPVEAGSASA